MPNKPKNPANFWNFYESFMGVSFFDVDNTLIRGTSGGVFLAKAIKEHVISPWRIKRLPLEYIRYRFGATNSDFIEKAVSMLGEIDEEAINNLAESCIHAIKSRIFTEGAALIKALQDAGETVCLATSSFSNLIAPLEQFLNLKDSVCSTLEYSGGKTTGRLTGKSPFGQKKKEAVEAWLAGHGAARSDTAFYSDSSCDLPLLEWCGHAVAVNPDRILARAAREHGWEILNWRQTFGK
jgi:HAD superfamily hydrolase (TIGR01490 family)